MTNDTQPQARASGRFLRTSATKVRSVAALIRGKDVDEARRILAFTPKSSGRLLAKVLESAISNAENNHAIPQEELFVKSVGADEGPIMKRIRPRAQGRAYRIRRRTSHVRVVLERKPQLAGESREPRRPRASKGKGEGGK